MLVNSETLIATSFRSISKLFSDNGFVQVLNTIATDCFSIGQTMKRVVGNFAGA